MSLAALLPSLIDLEEFCQVSSIETGCMEEHENGGGFPWSKTCHLDITKKVNTGAVTTMAQCDTLPLASNVGSSDVDCPWIPTSSETGSPSSMESLSTPDSGCSMSAPDVFPLESPVISVLTRNRPPPLSGSPPSSPSSLRMATTHAPRAKGVQPLHILRRPRISSTSSVPHLSQFDPRLLELQQVNESLDQPTSLSSSYVSDLDLQPQSAFRIKLPNLDVTQSSTSDFASHLLPPSPVVRQTARASLLPHPRLEQSRPTRPTVDQVHDISTPTAFAAFDTSIGSFDDHDDPTLSTAFLPHLTKTTIIHRQSQDIESLKVKTSELEAEISQLRLVVANLVRIIEG
ncbi:hypothetical protein OIO90_002704 [Microbotryomycetes sp. JL221]|nr:hypothetical protein OIO90_002704 [Microbotryomycetes sp. JL221]